MPIQPLMRACVSTGVLDKNALVRRLGTIRDGQRDVSVQLNDVRQFSQQVHRTMIHDTAEYEGLQRLREDLRQKEVEFNEQQTDLALEAETITASLVATSTLYETLSKAMGEDMKNFYGNAYKTA